MALKKSKERDGVLLAFLLLLSMFSGRAPSARAATGEHSYLVFQDGFEDGDADGWAIDIPPDAPSGSGWAVELDDGNQVLRESGHVWAEAGNYAWTNYTLEARVKILVPVGGGVHINFRMSGPGGRYLLAFAGALSLHKEHPAGTFYNLKTLKEALLPNRWYTIKIVCVGNIIEVYVDEALRLSYTDEEAPLLSGRIGLESAPGSKMYFDDIRVYTTHRLYVTHLIGEARDEIDEAKTLGADTAEAEGRLAEAQAAFEEGGLSLAEDLAKEAADIAEHAYIGPVSVSDLSKYSAEYDQRTVEVSGSIRDIRYEEGVYGFAVDDGTGVVSATFEGSLGEIKTDDKVRVVGIFDASAKTMAAESLEKLKTPTEGLYMFLIFKDDFEDGDYSDWRINVNPEVEGSSWDVVMEDDNYVLRGKGHGHCMAGDEEWTDYILEFKVKLVKGMAFINFRFTQKTEAPDRYVLRLFGSHMALLKGERYPDERHFTELKRVSTGLSPGVWYAVKILCLGDGFKVYLDDSLKLDYTDEDDPFLSGTIGFEPVPYEGGKPSHVLFDDVKVSRMATTGDIGDLITYAESEIDKARDVNADVGAAELKLEQARQALAKEDYRMVQYLVDEAVWLAKRSSIGRIQVKDLLATATRIGGHTVTLTGIVRSLEARYGVGYDFQVDDGTGRVSVAYQGAAADIGEGYEVQVTGVFDASSGAVTASSVEKLSAPQASQTGITWSIEAVAALITVLCAGLGAAGWMAKTWSMRRRKRVLFKKLMSEIDDIYARFKMNAHRCESELHRLRGECLEEFKEGTIDEDRFNILTERIEEHMREVREEIERNNV